MLGSFVDTCVRLARFRNELTLRMSTDRVSNLHSIYWHTISHRVVGQVHVLVEEGLEFRSDSEHLSSRVLEDVLPDELLFAHCRHILVLWSVQLLSHLALREIALCVGVERVPFRIVFTPIVCRSVRFRSVISLTVKSLFLNGDVFIHALLSSLNRTRLRD